MQFRAYAPVQRIVGILLVFLSLGFLPPLLFAYFGRQIGLGAYRTPATAVRPAV